MTASGAALDAVQGLWVDGRLSELERLSIASFLAHGHGYHLYTYGDVPNAPAGAVIRDAREILPESRIFQYRDHASFAGFANFFRYRLLLERGGWWADTDTVCLKPFALPQEYVFSSELVSGQVVVNCGVIKAPPGSEVMRHAWTFCETRSPETLVWGETGSRLMGDSVRRCFLEPFVMGPDAFCPIGFREWASVLDPTRAWTWSDDVYAVHLWNEMWRRHERDKSARYDPACLYERLKRRYLPLAVAGAP